MKLQRILWIGTIMLALVVSAAAIAGKGGGGGGQGGQGGQGGMGGVDAPKPMSQEKTRVRVEGGEQKGELVRERNEGEMQGGAKGSGGGKQDLEVNPLGSEKERPVPYRLVPQTGPR